MAADQTGGTLRPGEILNNTYIIEELIAVGGTGEVYRARNRAAGREIAVKILRREFATNETFLDLMRREAAVLHEVQDDAVVRYYDILHSEMHGGFIFLVMEFIRGESLADRMKRGPVDEDTCLTVARRMARGLRASHDKKAYHRDLSPDNVILRDNDPSRAVLIDFGIAKDVNEDARTVIGGGFAGKYQYAAPEQIDGRADGRSDLYSLGMTLIGAFRGRAPSAGSSYLEIIRMKGEKPDISDLPGRLRDLVDRLADPDPEARLQTPQDVLDFLGDGPGAPAGTVPPTDRPVSHVRPAPAPRRERSGTGAGIWVALLVLLAALGGGGWYFGLGPGREMIAGPELPRADPYRMEILMAGPGRMRVNGHAPSPEAAAAAMSALSTINGGPIPEGAIKAATGLPHPQWTSAVLTMARAASVMPVWWIYVEGSAAEIAGEVTDAATRETVMAAAMTAAQEARIDLVGKIELIEPPLRIDALTREVNAFSTCGTLAVDGGSDGIVPPDAGVTIAGRVARERDRGLIADAVRPLTGDRALSLDLEVLNPSVCRVVETLPPARDPALSLLYEIGGTGETPEGDLFHENQWPVISLELPAEAGDWLYVFYVGLNETIYHILPRLPRPGNRIAEIGTVADGRRVVRLTWPEEESSEERLGFISAPPFGTNLIVAVVSAEPLFDELRPGNGESVDALLGPLARGLAGTDVLVTWRPLVTGP